jgi:serine/threonine-protein kinase
MPDSLISMSFENVDLPRQFGQYLLKRRIARGGMSELYLGETHGPGGFSKPVVVKMINDKFSEDQRFLAMFTDEAKILADLAHGNIVPIFDFGIAEGRLYLVMEFIDGVDVATMTDTCRLQGFVLPLDVALWIGVGSAAGLSHAHQATDSQKKPLGIVHRDMSPHNILVSRSGEVKLCDFGIAMSAAKEAETDAGVIKGKLRYLSPEQAQGGAIDIRSDVFSLGVVLYELATGSHPVPSGADVMVIQMLSGDKGYPLLGETAPWVPKAVAKAVDRAMAFDPDNRHQTAEEFQNELSRILYGQFPDFTPKRLAELVCKVQAANEKSKSRDIDSVMRANLASFASSVRESIQKRTTLPVPAQKRKRPLVLAGAAAALILFAMVLIGLLKERPARPGESEDRTEAAARSQPSAQSKESHAALTPKTPTKGGKDLSRAFDAGPAVAPNRSGHIGEANEPDAASQPATADSKEQQLAVKPKKRAFGTVNIQADPWAEVRISGVSKGETPIMGLKMPVGKYKAVFENSELAVTKTRSFEVEEDKTTVLTVEME